MKYSDLQTFNLNYFQAQTPPPSSLSLHCSSPYLPPSLHLASPLYSVRELEVQGCSLPSCHLPGSPCNSLLSLLPSLTHISLHGTGTQGLPSNLCRFLLLVLSCPFF